MESIAKATIIITTETSSTNSMRPGPTGEAELTEDMERAYAQDCAVRSIREKENRRFKQFAHGLDIARSVPAIDNTVVATDRQVHQLCRDNLAIADDRPFNDAIGSNDGDFRPVDDGCRRNAAQWPE
jgi:hypothetical protein